MWGLTEGGNSGEGKERGEEEERSGLHHVSAYRYTTLKTLNL